MSDPESANSPGALVASSRDCGVSDKSKIGNLESLAKRQLQKIKYARIDENPQTAIYKFTIIIGFASVVLSLICVCTVLYTSFQTAVASPPPDAASSPNPDYDLSELPEVLTSIVYQKMEPSLLYNVLVNDPKDRRRRSAEDAPANEIGSGVGAANSPQTKYINQKTACEERFEACQKILNSMQTLTATATDNIETLNSLLSAINNPEGALSQLIQCVECQNLEKVMLRNNGRPAWLETPQDPSRSMIQHLNVPVGASGWPDQSPPNPAIKFNKSTVIVNSPDLREGVRVSEAGRPTIHPIAQAPPIEFIRTGKADEPVKYRFPLLQNARSHDYPSASPSEVHTGGSEPFLSVQGPAVMNNFPRMMQTPFQQNPNYETNPPVIPTAETVKTGQQVQINAPMSPSGPSICFFPPPNQGPTGQPSPPGFPQPSGFPYPSAPGQFLAPGQYQPRGFSSSGQAFPNFQSAPAQNRFYGTLPNNPGGGYPGWMPPTGPGQAFVRSGSQGQPYYCIYGSPLVNQFPGGPGFQRNAGSNRSNPEQQLAEGDGQAWDGNRAYPEQCKQDELMCMDGKMCIPKQQWCDARINCPDASDEMTCSCRDRINKNKLCDGYFDCPRGEDELGCFGCPPDSFSCQDWNRYYKRENCVPMTQRCDGISQCPNGRDEMDCTMLTQSIATDDDVLLTGYLTGFLHKNYKGKWYPVCTAAPKWAIDACAAEAGTAISEVPRMEAKVIPQGTTPGLYLSVSPSNEVELTYNCNNQGLFIECPPIPCGSRVISEARYRPFGMYEDSLVAAPINRTSATADVNLSAVIQQLREAISARQNANQIPNTHIHRIRRGIVEDLKELANRTSSSNSVDIGNHKAKILQDLNEIVNVLNKVNKAKYVGTTEEPVRKPLKDYTEAPNVGEEIPKLEGRSGMSDDDRMTDDPSSDLRIVGGRSSHPQAWPFLVALYKDGYFLCGAVILDELWIMTAAHCVDGHQAHYYEVQAGLLRRYSYSPMAQSRRVHYITLHPGYNRATMNNDIALVKLDNPLHFNRWIRPTCLPEYTWRPEPTPESTCIAIGWGATVEHGPDPDDLREVQVPILAECKYQGDRIDEAICAGALQGGKDACQGDSGGPLMCQYPNSQDQWYAAGIVSRGEGCGRKNEPGVYTRVGKHMEWINSVKNSFIAPSEIQTKQCQGHVCDGGLGKCIPANRRCNGIVDCLNADDEKNCPNPPIFLQSRITENSPQTVGNPNNQSPILVHSRNHSSMIEMPPEYPHTPSPSAPSSSPPPSYFIPTAAFPQATSKIETTERTTSPTAWPTPSPLPPPTPAPEVFNDLSDFRCIRMSQTIPLHKRCDKIIDCEDGTDEENCTCKDILSNTIPSAICDGHIDCHDQTDEKDCKFCKDDQFTCSRSGRCIAKTQVCDTIPQCPLKEDEFDCFTLSNNHDVVYDLENRTYLNQEGVLSRITNGVWRPICSTFDDKSAANVASNACSYLGLKGHEFVKNVTVVDEPLTSIHSTPGQLIPYRSEKLIPPTNNSKTCQGLYIKCQTALTSSVESHRVEHMQNKPVNTSYLFPWEAAIFVEGRYHCPGVLLDYAWVMTSARCTHNLDLKNNYTTVVVGLSPTFQYADGPHQQVVKVNSVRAVDPGRTEASLIHLKTPVNMTRNVKPVFYDKLIFPGSENDECVALGTDEKFVNRKTFFTPVIKDCPNCHRCYVNGTSEFCTNNETRNWDGLVVCRGRGGWYPTAVFHDKDMLCGFATPQTLTSIDYYNPYITQAMDKKMDEVQAQECEGLRCDIGNCVHWGKICDGVRDCRNGEDEADGRCEERRINCERSGGIGCTCGKTELRCKSGQCVGKEKFCDGVYDCLDRSDEPDNCTCGDYLKLAMPKLVCDNVRHCWDKTDETDKECLCKDSSFQCWNTTTQNGPCIPHDFVCDGFNDCENGADEKNCRTIKGHQDDSKGVGQILQRSSGVWHSECFPSPITSSEEAVKICRSLGYYDGAILSPSETGKYGDALVPSYDSFFMVTLNNNKTVHMRGDRPLVGLKPAKNVCHRAFVRCSSEIHR